MRRLLILLLALLLPLQFAWAAAAAYCQHEVEPARVTHVGHHEHAHQADAKKADPKKASDSKPVADLDCKACNAAATPLIPMTAAPTGRPVLLTAIDRLDVRPLPSAPTRAPDRPQWPRLA